MEIGVETKDCTALGDAEIAELADLCADNGIPFDIGMLSKEREDWVLVTRVWVDDDVSGFSFCTLERIGGTPSVLMGLAGVKRGDTARTVLDAIVDAQYRRAVLAFPDEDVLVGTRLVRPDGYDAFVALDDIVPRPDHKANGEERAWGRRLVKRFGGDGKYADREFRVAGAGSPSCVLDYESPSGGTEMDGDHSDRFDGVDQAKGDCVVVFGWAMAEFLAKLAD